MHLSSVTPEDTMCLCHKSLPVAGISIGMEGITREGGPRSAAKLHSFGFGKTGGCIIISGSPYRAPALTQLIIVSMSFCGSLQSP